MQYDERRNRIEIGSVGPKTGGALQVATTDALKSSYQPSLSPPL